MINDLKKDGDTYLDKDGVTHFTKKDYLQTNILNFCGCGYPDAIMIYIRDLLIRLDKKEWGEYEDMPYMFFVYWANHKGFAEHGTTVRCSWLTDKGKELLADIEWCLNNPEKSVMDHD